jgi:hypothetical protein
MLAIISSLYFYYYLFSNQPSEEEEEGLIPILALYRSSVIGHVS